MSGYKLVVEKSTSPVRTAERIKQTLRRYGNGNDEADVAVNPEFMQEGTAFHDILHPDRIILGVESTRARQLLECIYRPLLDHLPEPGECQRCDRLGRSRRTGDPVIVTNLATAELIKHAANAFLATKISFINMIADLCEATGADIIEVAHGIGLDPRIGPHFLKAGIGFGGYCLPKDLRALTRIGQDFGVALSLLDEVASINEQRIDRFCNQVRGALWVIRGKTIGVLGLAFKSGTDDLREAPSLKILARLLAEGASLRVHDPRAMDNLSRLLPERPGRLVYCRAPYDVATGASGLLVLTEWDEYRTLDLARIRKLMEVPILFDGRNLYDPVAVRSLGFEYHGVGRQSQGSAYPAAAVQADRSLATLPA
jgi:UDPglucose 6-dehydrogenase